MALITGWIYIFFGAQALLFPYWWKYLILISFFLNIWFFKSWMIDAIIIRMIISKDLIYVTTRRYTSKCSLQNSSCVVPDYFALEMKRDRSNKIVQLRTRKILIKKDGRNRRPRKVYIQGHLSKSEPLGYCRCPETEAWLDFHLSVFYLLWLWIFKKSNAPS